jgi:signal peptidase I
MNVLVLFWASLVTTLVLAAVIFIRQRNRLAQAESQDNWTRESLEAVFAPSLPERIMGYVLLVLLLALIWQTIQQSFDFALLLAVATLVTGVVYLADVLLLGSSRRKVLAAAEQDIADFSEIREQLNPEPGLIENSRSFFPVLLIVFVLRSFLFEPFQIPSGSMKPTLEIGDFIIVNRFTYGLRMPVTNDVVIPVNQPVRGDVIVFRPPHEPSKNFIKRVIGLPGDLVQYDYGRRQLSINGEAVEIEFEQRSSDTEGRYTLYSEQLGNVEHLIYQNQSGPNRHPHEWLSGEGVVVPEGHYFVMGDNRDASHDSRYWEGQRRLQQRDYNNDGDNAWGFVDENAILGEAVAVWMTWKGWYPSFSRVGAID